MTPRTTTLPILLASDFPIFRDSLKTYFEETPEIELVGCATDRNQVIPLLKSCKPRLVLLDLDIELDALCALLDEIHSTPNVRSLIMSDVMESSRVIQVLRHGANGIVPRRTTHELFTKSIQAVLAGDFWVSRAMISDFVHMIRQDAAGGVKVPETLDQPETCQVRGSLAGAPQVDISRFGLTPRELQVIGALSDGQTNKDIGSTFGISEYTVKHHLTNVYDKLGVYNRVELVLFAINHHLCATPGAVAVP